MSVGTRSSNLRSDGGMKEIAMIFFDVLINQVYLSVFRKLCEVA